MPNNKREERLTKLEDVVRQHLVESGSIQANLKFNTWLTGAVAVAIIARSIADIFAK